MSCDLIEIGSVQSSYGKLGEVIAVIENRDNIPLKPGLELWLGTDPENRFTCVIGCLRQAGKNVRIGFNDFSAPDQSRKLVGLKIWIPAHLLKPLETGCYYHYQLIGMNVRTTAECDLGSISDVIQTGANDVFVVKSGSREHLIPAVASVIKTIDVVNRLMIIEEMPNMLDQDSPCDSKL